MGTQIWGCLWWGALLSLPLAVARGVKITAEEPLIMAPQMQRPDLKFLPRLSKVAFSPGILAARRLQQSGNPLCTWGDSCKARYFSNAPDAEVSMFGKDTEMCVKISSKDDCLDVLQCNWYEAPGEEDGICALDFFHTIQGCLQPDFMVVFFGHQCATIFREDRCRPLPGCQWNDTDAKCQMDQAAVAEAIGSNSALASTSAQNEECQQSSPCLSPCWEDESGACVSPQVWNISAWFSPTATSTYCQYLKLNLGCSFASPVSTCSGACGIDEEGVCSLSDVSTIEFLYSSSEAERTKWLGALEACSAIKDPGECGSFAGGK
ncbi:unnamed protein product [Ostreobium quekettii]|uniref:Uncharacterized protein n=1 Tax=Ostreobium quekettii TaxID=121088 RepID=A0A8S1IXP2_9CHLO|nr:unnamed protein product [Ostreobium quekettii]